MITRESNNTVPSSLSRAGIFPSGFCRRSESPASPVSARSSAISRSSPSRLAAILTLRTNGEAGERSEEHTSELQSHSDLVCRLLLEKKKKKKQTDETNRKIG